MFSTILTRQILDNKGELAHCVDGKNESHGNWLRFINTAACKDEQNLLPLQCWGQMFYLAYKPIPPGAEILVWYGHRYAEHLGLPLASI